MAPSMRRKTALVTGANGFLGNAVAKAFVSAGYDTYGLTRKAEAISQLQSEEITPVLGTIDDLSFIPQLRKYSTTFDVIVSTTEDLMNWESHFRSIEAFVLSVAKTSLSQGVRSLVLFSSGVKDYGAGNPFSPTVAPFTEDSPLLPPPALEPRARLGLTILDHKDIFDAVVLRPTTLFGFSSSYYGPAFAIAAAAATSGSDLLQIPGDAQSIMHGTHITDCAAAYIAIAEAPRDTVTGQCYNISAAEYETTETVAKALAKEYGLSRIEYLSEMARPSNQNGLDVVRMLFGFSQWVGSEKIRQDTGWKDVRPLFSEGIHVYRKSYEEAEKRGHSNVQRVNALITRSHQ